MPPLDCITKTRDAFALLATLSDTHIELLQIALHHRLQVGVDDDGAGALVFAELRQDYMRQRKRKPKLFEHAADGALVFGIREGEQGRDGNRFGAAGVYVAGQHLEIFA